MKNKLALLAATVLAGGVLAAPALADVTVTVDVEKDKIIDVTENVSINKHVTVTVTFAPGFEGLAEADALVNATIDDHDVLLVLPGFVDPDDSGGSVALGASYTKRLADIDDSINDNLGVVLQFNQDVGDNSNQGNVVSAALTDVDDQPDTPNNVGVESVVAHAEAGVDQKNTNNDTFVVADFPDPDLEDEPRPGPDPDNPIPGPGSEANEALLPGHFHFRAEITDSVNRNIGVIHVNQNAGIDNNQHNVLALAVGLSAGLALGEGALGQENAHNTVQDFNTYKRSVIDNSVSSNTGVVGVNQNSGHNNNQAAVINIAATTAATQLVPIP